MLFTNCVTYNDCDHNIYILFQNNVTYNECDPNMYMLFIRVNNIFHRLNDIQMPARQLPALLGWLLASAMGTKAKERCQREVVQ